MGKLFGDSLLEIQPTLFPKCWIRLSRLGIDREELPRLSTQINAPPASFLPVSHSSTDKEAQPALPIESGVEGPQLFAPLWLQSDQAVKRGGDVHHTIHDQWSTLKGRFGWILGSVAEVAGIESPGWLEL